jgi:4-hydroxy-2-oxoheptanedioate aldolase
MTGRDLKEALRAGRRVYGTCVVSTSPAWPPMIAGAGLDFVFIDTEHIPIDRAQLSWMCRTYAALGLPPVVRIPKVDATLACMALDGGAAGIVAPYMERVEEVHQLRGAVKYRPLKGARLDRALHEHEVLDPELRGYLDRFNANNVCIVNIESVPAMLALDDILAVPDVDAVLVGPHDLSISLGIPEQYTHPKFTAAMEAIISRCRAADIGVGFHFSFGVGVAIEWAKLGANFIVHSTDLFLVRDALQRELRQFRTTVGDGPPRPTAGESETGHVVV